MIKIIDYNEKYKNKFEEMFLYYFTVDCPIGCGENSVKEKIFDNCVIPQFEKQIIDISLILVKNKTIFEKDLETVEGNS